MNLIQRQHEQHLRVAEWRKTMTGLNVDVFKKRVKKLGLTQKQVAKELGISETTITHWINQRSSANGVNQQRLAALLKVDARELFPCQSEDEAPYVEPKEKILDNGFYCQLLSTTSAVASLCGELSSAADAGILPQDELSDLLEKTEDYFSYLWNFTKRQL